jgi:hypothetical protein
MGSGGRPVLRRAVAGLCRTYGAGDGRGPSTRHWRWFYDKWPLCKRGVGNELRREVPRCARDDRLEKGHREEHSQEWLCHTRIVTLAFHGPRGGVECGK